MRRSHPPKTNTLSTDSYSWDLDQFIWLIQPRMTLVFATIIIPKVWILRIRELTCRVNRYSGGRVRAGMSVYRVPRNPRMGIPGIPVGIAGKHRNCWKF